MMNNYEILMLVRTEITKDELSALERQLDKIVAAKDARITLFDRWGKYKLAFPVNKNMYGVYLLARYEVPVDKVQELAKEIDTFFRIKYNELVMRHTTVKLAGKSSTMYKYPEAISSHGTSNLDSFIKENKMEGLIEAPVEKKTETKKKVETPEEPTVQEPSVAEETKEEQPEERQKTEEKGE